LNLVRYMKLKKYEFLQTISKSINDAPSAADFLKDLPELICKYLPIKQVIIYYRGEAGNRFQPYPDQLDNISVPCLDEQSEMIRGFVVHRRAMCLDEQETTVYREVFDKNAGGLLDRFQLNLLIPLHSRRYYRGLVVCRIEPKKVGKLKEIEELINTAALLFVPIIEMERMELENDRNYYRLFKFDRLVLLGEMVASIAHELKTPMGTVLMEVQELTDKLKQKADSSIKQSCRKIKTEIQRVNQFIRSLLNFSRFKEITVENLSLNAFVNEALSEVPEKRKPIALKLNTRLKNDQVIPIDRNRLRQVFFNILFNAFEAVGKGGIVNIETYWQLSRESKIKQHIIAIRDNGSGIPDELLDRIMAPFFTTKEDGTGLGLYISQGIMKNLNGELKVESNSSGTTVYIILNSEASMLL